jgi:hypothetical protein
MIIGVCGLIGSGKGTVADMLVAEHGFVKLSFADKLKDAVAEMFDWPRDMVEGDTNESREWREQLDTFWTKETGRDITPRLVLQEFGTECMRAGFYDGIWVSLVKKRILDNPTTNFVIPDTRFPNEIKMIQELSGNVWWVRRGKLPGWFVDYRISAVEPADIHSSEWAWGRTSFDQIIDNNETVTELRNQVVDLLVSNENLPFAKVAGS